MKAGSVATTAIYFKKHPMRGLPFDFSGELLKGGLSSSDEGFYSLGSGVFKALDKMLIPVRVSESGPHVDIL